MPIPNDLGMDTLKAHLSFDTSASQLPPGLTSDRLATFEVSGSVKNAAPNNAY